MIDTSYKQYTLDNGLIVALKNIPCKTVYSTLRVKLGAIDERIGEEGLAHFLEHNITHGGKGINRKETIKKLGIFGEFYAYTYIDKTTFNIGVMPKDIDKVLNYLATSAFNPAFNPELLEKEKNIVLREIADTINDKPNSPTTIFTREYFGEEHIKLLKRLLDSKYATLLQNVTVDSLINIHDRGYATNNSDLIIVGELPKDIEELIQKNFGGYQKKDCSRVTVPNMDPSGIKIVHVQRPEFYYAEDPKESTVKFTLGIPMAKYHDEEYFNSYAISQIIGDGYSSRLLDTLRHDKGLIYNLQARYVTDTYSNRMEIIGEIPSMRRNEIIGSIFDEFNKFQTIQVLPEEIEKVLQKNEYRLTKAYNYPETIASHIAANIEFGATTDNDINRLKAVTPQNIMHTAKKYLPKNQQEGNYVLLLRDPLKDIENLDPNAEQCMEFI